MITGKNFTKVSLDKNIGIQEQMEHSRLHKYVKAFEGVKKVLELSRAICKYPKPSGSFSKGVDASGKSRRTLNSMHVHNTRACTCYRRSTLLYYDVAL